MHLSTPKCLDPRPKLNGWLLWRCNDPVRLGPWQNMNMLLLVPLNIRRVQSLLFGLYVPAYVRAWLFTLVVFWCRAAVIVTTLPDPAHRLVLLRLVLATGPFRWDPVEVAIMLT